MAAVHHHRREWCLGAGRPAGRAVRRLVAGQAARRGQAPVRCWSAGQVPRQREDGPQVARHPRWAVRSGRGQVRRRRRPTAAAPPRPAPRKAGPPDRSDPEVAAPRAALAGRAGGDGGLTGRGRKRRRCALSASTSRSGGMNEVCGPAQAVRSMGQPVGPGRDRSLIERSRGTRTRAMVIGRCGCPGWVGRSDDMRHPPWRNIARPGATKAVPLLTSRRLARPPDGRLVSGW